MTVIDVRDLRAVESAAERVRDADERLVALVWAAGVFQWGRFDTVDPAGARDVLITNFTAAAAAARLFLPLLLSSAPSNLIFMGSGAGHQAYPDNAA